MIEERNNNFSSSICELNLVSEVAHQENSTARRLFKVFRRSRILYI
jgi:hypothetical protein